ncbi:hypothetical protein KDN34_09070 [Shewanella yunxiaonensis]|uniref:Uncharacterized protein n=1 Tax=Shewanella yunxiaonensis TaxID=2829809 RepID=A0ABX7YQ47_9GAMM|nr:MULTISPECIES: hypothetical protein [Shewanella]MDF0535826.1 hypothetical protein [Shewanella sp. A32]QUN04441.1 hypothetical protein KDN34_09070 [Shewanella yunxiaonensis]
MTCALELKYPQEGPERLEALLSYLDNWYQYQHDIDSHTIKISVTPDSVKSDLFILKSHFPWLPVENFVVMNK